LTGSAQGVIRYCGRFAENFNPGHTKSRLIDSFRWVRFIASPKTGATLRTLILEIAFSGGSGIVSVITAASIGAF